MRARCVLTWKSSGKAKARLCVLGFQDPDLTEVSPDSPTLSTASEVLIMQWVASHKYRLISGDIKTAFLSGDEDVRNIFIAPPDDVRQMLNVDHETVLRLRKAVYGLVNAPKQWWDRLRKSLIQHGFMSCALDPCVFVLRKNGKIHGVLGVHVDDLIGSGNETFDRVMTAVREEFDFGTWDIGNFRFKGRQICQMPNGEIVFEMEQFKHELEQIKVSKADKSQAEGAYPIPRRCWETGLACGSLLSTVIISACRIASKTIISDSSRFVVVQQGDLHRKGYRE